MQKDDHMTEDKKRGLRLTLPMQIVGIAIIPVMILAVILSLVGVTSIRQGMQEEIIEKLHSVTTSMSGAMSALDSENYRLDEQGNLWKGNYNLTEHEEILDSMVEDTDTDITFFYDKTRRATTLKDKDTGERILGTDASDSVYKQVVQEGKVLTSYDLVINEEAYYAYYAPMKNSDGTIVGMYFAGTPQASLDKFIARKSSVLVISAVIIGIIAFVCIIISVRRIRNGIVETDRAVTNLAGGNLAIEVSAKAQKRNDELGDMAKAVAKLRRELSDIMQKVHHSSSVLLASGKELESMASQSSGTADEISHAVEDISGGAVSQAEEIEIASKNMEEMGSVIEAIVGRVLELDQMSAGMEKSRQAASEIIEELAVSNEKTLEAIARIGEQIKTTNESAGKISEAIQIIASIAEETNLLSLNASIEAARAGEKGKGFAVVANQIQVLAEQSNESSGKIEEIAKNLLQDSNQTVAVMQEVQQMAREESDKLQSTRLEFENVSQGIENSRAETNLIKEQTNICDASRKNVVDIIANLSAISEENAASTQETTASMQEFNATINLLASSAGKLTDLSGDLDEEIKFFKISENE